MQGFNIWDGNPRIASELIDTAPEEGLLLQTAGKEPMGIRMLPPFNLKRGELHRGFDWLEKALRRAGLRHELLSRA